MISRETEFYRAHLGEPQIASGNYPIRTAFRRFLPDYLKKHIVSSQQYKAASCIQKCKTGELGYSASYCPECGHLEFHARSCNNRDCPCCQAPLEKKWVMERNAELISGIAYYHVIFTVPYQLNDLILQNQKVLYGLLFSAASESLVTLCRDKKYMGATPGVVSVLHTWGQQLNFHPHLHTMVSGGGLDPSGRFTETRHKGFILPVQVLGKMFRGKYLSRLKQLYEKGRLSLEGSCRHLSEPSDWKTWIDRLYSITWCPFVKETFNGNGNALEYLARYAYRTAISNSRIETVTDTEVSFRYTDYADQNAKKVKTVSGEEFIRLFLTHVLPQGFHRVRFSGFLANYCKTKSLKHINCLRGLVYNGNPTKGMRTAELMMLLYHIDICRCPVCQHTMISSMRMKPPDKAA